MACDPFLPHYRRSQGLPVGCFVALVVAAIPLAIGSIAFEIWWRWTLFAAVIHFLNH